MIEDRQWLPDPPSPWYWQSTTEGRWELAHQDPHEGVVQACCVLPAGIGDPEVLAMIEYTIANLPPTYIAKSHGA